MSAYLTTIRTVMGERTLFEGVRTLRPGQAVVVEASGEDIAVRAAGTGRAAADFVVDPRVVGLCIRDSVERHLRSDVPLCCLLSEAYFARLLDLPFVAVMARSTSAEKVAQIAFYGGRCEFVEHTSEVYARAQAIAAETGGHYMDQFTYAERATDWRGNNNIAQSMFRQMEKERHPVPRWVVVGAGTGGTSATIGRFIRYQRHATQLCVADPAGSVFGAYHRSGDFSLVGKGSRIEGIGRPRVEASFIRGVVDRMLEVADVDSIAAMRVLSDVLGRKVGPSTGTNLVGMLTLTAEMRANGEQGSILSLLCDAGERYLPSYHNPQWVAENMGDCAAAEERIRKAMA